MPPILEIFNPHRTIIPQNSATFPDNSKPREKDEKSLIKCKKYKIISTSLRVLINL